MPPLRRLCIFIFFDSHFGEAKPRCTRYRLLMPTLIKYLPSTPVRLPNNPACSHPFRGRARKLAETSR